MRGNSHVQFLGGGTVVTPPCYPARGGRPAPPTRSVRLLQAVAFLHEGPLLTWGPATFEFGLLSRQLLADWSHRS